MKVFTDGCFNELYYRALSIAISHSLTPEPSRVGSMINLGQAYFEIDGEDPRLVFLNGRKTNPIFAIIEAAWVLSGSNLMAPLKYAISDYDKYSDDGKTLHGAYGHRLMFHFGVNQLEDAILTLKADQSTRRIVLTMYEPADITKKSLDIPCNTTIYLKVNAGHLDITILNRSNDLYLGIPYNVFVFGVLQAYLARRLGLKRGKQVHFTDCLHLYEINLQQAKHIVTTNNLGGIRFISSQFDWKYVEDVLDSAEEIASEKFENIYHEDLRILFSRFKANKVRHKKLSADSSAPKQTLLNFVFLQWKMGVTSNQQMGDVLTELQEKLMKNDMYTEITKIANTSRDEITQWITKRANQLHGTLPILIKILNKNSGLYSIRTTDRSENDTIRLILLSAMLTVEDPYLANTPIGQAQRQKMEAATQKLGLNVADICPLSHVEKELFETLDRCLLDRLF